MSRARSLTASRHRAIGRRARHARFPAPLVRQRGVALLVAILLVALGTIIAAAMAYSNAMTARRAAATFGFDQAMLIAEGAEALAAEGLKIAFKQNPQYISTSQSWAQPFGPVEAAPGVTLEAQLEDLQGRFNVNELVGSDGQDNPTAILVFQRLLQSLNLNAQLADDIADWIDQDTTPRSEGAEDSVYMGMDPPYRTPNMPITSTSELLAMPGMTRATFDRLAPHISALPMGAKINQCTADPWVLDALTGTVQFSADPDRFYKDRQAAGDCFPPVGQVKVQGAPPVTGPTAGGGLQSNPADLVTQTSTYFRLTSIMTLGSTEFTVYTLLFWDPTGVHTMMRSFTPD
jgi:general secretion pathway protein K